MDTKILFFVLLAYFLGSLNFAIIFTFHKLGKDIHSFGDGNPGATNVFLHVDRQLGFITGLLDALKGFLPLLIAVRFGICGIPLAFIAGGAILGHQYPVFYKFRGGTGIAATIGVVIFFAPKPALYIFIFSCIVIIVANQYKMHNGGRFSALETGEAAGFILLLLYALFSSNVALKIFVLLDIALIILRRRARAEELLFGHLLKKSEKHTS